MVRADGDHDAVCAATGRHNVVVAPPGTGKTFLAARLAGVEAAKLSGAERVLMLTFSNQARVQLEHEAARQLTVSTRFRVEVSNYHRFFRREVWAYRRALGLPLEAQIGSARRRRAAFARADRDAVARLKRASGLLEALLEHRFPRFRDDRTPDERTLSLLLSVVNEETRAGTLVFDDLGALFWMLIEAFPVVAEAYAGRYAVVIADEHQDASELQDAVVRLLGRKRLFVFADPMQLIYDFRGSRPERLQRHVAEADGRFRLRTAHRWHDAEQTGRWLFAVRARLSREPSAAAAPPGEFALLRTNYPGQAKARAKEQALRAFRDGMRSVAILTRENDEAGGLRAYLCRNGLHPRQVGGDDLDEAQEDIEELPGLAGRDLACRALDRIASLVPTLADATVAVVRGRLDAHGVNAAGRLAGDTPHLLRALAPLYDRGPRHYFSSVAEGVEGFAARGHHLPRIEAVRALRMTTTADDGNDLDLPTILARHAQNVVMASQMAPRFDRGLFVMTVHQAKGKEFDVVIIANAAARAFPDSDDGRRLLYVAVTRASRRWIVIAPASGASPLLQHLLG